jgi:hypothetical protein
MPTMSPDVNSASEISQRYNVIIYSLYEHWKRQRD